MSTFCENSFKNALRIIVDTAFTAESLDTSRTWIWFQRTELWSLSNCIELFAYLDQQLLSPRYPIQILLTPIKLASKPASTVIFLTALKVFQKKVRILDHWINAICINQSINPSIHHSVNQSINQSINQSVSQSMSQSINQSASQSMSQSINQSIINVMVTRPE